MHDIDRMSNIDDLAESLGRALGSTLEYRALARAKERADDDRQVVSLRNELQEIEASLESTVRHGKEPESADVERYQQVMGRLQALSSFQSLVAAQANLDKIMARVNEGIQKGMRQGGASRIILTS